MKAFQVSIYIFLLLFSGNAFAQFNIGQVDQSVITTIERLLRQPESRIDFAHSKLVIDKIIDPSIDIPKEKQRLDSMVKAIRSMEFSPNKTRRKNALRKYLYESGSWNNNKPFQYDFDDPLGTKLENKLLSQYVSNRKGNCVSMPLLFIILGQKLGLDMTIADAPLHLFVKFTDEKNITHNLETTSGGNPARDVWLIKNFSISQRAINQDIYLKKRTKRQTVATMVLTLVQHYFEQKQYAQAIALAKVILRHHPKNVNAIIYVASAHNELLKKAGLWNYHRPSEVPNEKREYFKYLNYTINTHHIRAEKLGWRPLTASQNDTYINNVKKEARRFNNG